MSRTKTHVTKGDLVEVITGDHKGARGAILQVVHKKESRSGSRVLVEGVNMIKKSVRPSQDRPQGGFLEREATIHISNVKLVERKSGKSVEKKK
jgi:large subunit ribosomal protein L24